MRIISIFFILFGLTAAAPGLLNLKIPNLDNSKEQNPMDLIMKFVKIGAGEGEKQAELLYKYSIKDTSKVNVLKFFE
ncbi:hypothetical protein ACKWTF_016493 [Chironomus riparius]